MDEGRLRRIFDDLDVNKDGSLDVTELTRAFSKTGESPSIAQIYAYIAEVDTTGSKTVEFDEFVSMVDKIRSGALPSNTGIASLIREAMEEYIKDINKPVEAPKIIAKFGGGKGGGEANNSAPQGQKYVLKKKGPKTVKYENLPSKKSLADLP